MTFEELVREVQSLPLDQRKQMIIEIVDTFTISEEGEKKHSILEFEGIAEHLRDMDAQEYVDQLRSEWDHHP